MKRLCDETLSADAARILRSAESDAPPVPGEQQARIIEAYGVMRPALLAAGGASGLRRRTWAVVASTFLVAGGILVAWPRGSAEKAPAAIATIALPMSPAQPVVPQASEPTVRVEDLPAAPAAISSAPRAVGTIPVGDELAAVDAARGALRTGHPEETLKRIAACRTQFPRPLYAEEADALEVQALSALGRSADARAKAAVFFRAHPDSAYEQRIRAATAEAQP